MALALPYKISSQNLHGVPKSEPATVSQRIVLQCMPITLVLSDFGVTHVEAASFIFPTCTFDTCFIKYQSINRSINQTISVTQAHNSEGFRVRPTAACRAG